MKPGMSGCVRSWWPLLHSYWEWCLFCSPQGPGRKAVSHSAQLLFSVWPWTRYWQRYISRISTSWCKSSRKTYWIARKRNSPLFQVLYCKKRLFHFTAYCHRTEFRVSIGFFIVVKKSTKHFHLSAIPIQWKLAFETKVLITSRLLYEQSIITKLTLIVC